MSEFPDGLGGSLRGRLTREGATELYAIHGELDVAATELLPARLAEVGAEDGSDVVVDLAGVGFIDSRGLRVLIELQRTRPGLTFRAPSAAVTHVLEITGLTEHLRVEAPGS